MCEFIREISIKDNQFMICFDKNKTCRKLQENSNTHRTCYMHPNFFFL